MPGMILRAVPRQVFTFTPPSSGVAAGVSTVIAKGLDISQFRELTMLLRVHSGTSFPGGVSATVAVHMEAPTMEDPSQDFVAASPLLTGVSITNGTTVPSLQPSVLTAANAGGWVRVVLTWANTSATTVATLAMSVDLVAKS